MSTVGLLTFHKSYNYGASLQAYASWKYLQQLGYAATVIDYENSFEKRTKNLLYSPNGSAAGYAKSAVKNLLLGARGNLRRNFDSFHKLMQQTPQAYTAPAQLEALHFDALVCGSDQIWNPAICGGLDTAFFLQHGQVKRRISMATSAGSYSFCENEAALMGRYLSRFDSISVREEMLAVQLREKTGCKGVQVIADPTTLFDAPQWLSMLPRGTHPKAQAPYALVYLVGQNITAYSAGIQSLAQGLPCHYISPYRYPWPGVDKTLTDVTPPDFVRLIEGAELVITNSFHGMVFSLLFARPFAPLVNKANPMRAQNLLCLCGLDTDASVIAETEAAEGRKRLLEAGRKAGTWVESALAGL